MPSVPSRGGCRERGKAKLVTSHVQAGSGSSAAAPTQGMHVCSTSATKVVVVFLLCSCSQLSAFLPATTAPRGLGSQKACTDSSLQRPALSTSETAQVLDILFPQDADAAAVSGAADIPAYSERLWLGREAQGFMAEGGSLALSSSSMAGELTYGEFPWDFVSAVVDECVALRGGSAQGLTFLDLGSGVGRLVIGQALRHPWKACLGIEVVLTLHDVATAALTRARAAAASPSPFTQPHRAALSAMAPCACHLGDVLVPGDSELSRVLGSADVVFCYCSTWPAQGDLLTGLSFALGTALGKGALVVTTDRRLASEPGVWEFELLSTREGVNSETGGVSVAYVWEVTRSSVGAA